MQQFAKIGVFLTGAPADAGAIAHAGLIAQIASTEQILCLCDGETYTPGGQPDAASVEAEVRKHLPAGVHDRVEVRLFSDNSLAQTLRLARDEKLDLLVKGRRLPANELAKPTLFTRLVRKAPCTTLVVPGMTRVHMTRLLVPVDFSDHSRLALETAIDFARAAGKQAGQSPQVVVLTTFAVEYGYAKTGVTLPEAAAQIEAATCDRLKRFLAGVDTSGVEFDSVCMCSEQTSAAIHEVAAARRMDMIVVGSRGASASVVAILGSTAEAVVVSAALPVLVVKKKGETTGLLNALLAEM